MQENEIHENQQTDVFSKIIKDKLLNHPLAVDADCWSEIEAKLNDKRKKHIPFWWWLSGGAAVAAIALLFMFQPFSEQNSLNTITKQDENKHLFEKTKPVKDLEMKNEKLIVEISNSPIKSRKQVFINKKNIALRQITVFDQTNLKKNNITENKTEKAFDNHGTTETANQSVNTIDDSIPVQSPKQNRNSVIAEQTNNPTNKSKKNQWLLAAAFSTADGAPGGSNGTLMADGNNSIVNANTNYTSIMASNDFTKKTFMPAISFGFVISKNLDSHLSIESGLIYSYLQTKFSNSGSLNYNAELNLHYLGIPVNLVANLWNNQKWKIYLSSGFMVEKGLRSIYIQNQQILNQMITTRAFTNIAGVQLSVNASLGLEYKIQRNIGLYFEPKLSYYFDNNQPISIRTDTPMVLGFTAGLRYQLK